MMFFRIAQHFVPTLLTGLFLVGIPAYVHFTFEPPLVEGDTMDIRPNAPGSPEAVLEKHEATCWTETQKGPTTGAIIRIKPNGPVIRTHKRHLVERALDQVINKKDRGLDGVFAFCTNPANQKRN